MDKITTEYIQQHAPDASTIKNANTLCNKNSFINQSKTENDDLYFAECTGSGKTNYKVSVDFLVANQPVFRCSCPSRKLPCKHSIGLLQDILNGTTYNVAEIPEDVASKRDKAQKRVEKKEAIAKGEIEVKPKKVNKAARIKKMKKQLEGLELAKTFINDNLNRGLSTIDLQPATTYTKIAKEFGNYYLTGIQSYVTDIIVEIDIIKLTKKAKLEPNYNNIIDIFVKLNSLTKKSYDYLSTKVENEDTSDDDNELFELLGGVWTLEQLNAIDLKKDDANLIQLGFYYDTIVDVGYFCDVDTGKINPTYNYRPLKAAKYIKQEDSCNEKLIAKPLTYYPGDMGRIRYNEHDLIPIENDDYTKINSFALDINSVLKEGKNYFKNSLSKNKFPVLIAYEKIAQVDDQLILFDKNDTKIKLICSDIISNNIKMLPTQDYYENNSLFGELFYDYSNRCFSLAPLSIICDNEIVRL